MVTTNDLSNGGFFLLFVLIEVSNKHIFQAQSLKLHSMHIIQECARSMLPNIGA